MIGNQIPYHFPSSFFRLRFFSGCTFTAKLQVPTSTIQFLWWGYRILFCWYSLLPVPILWCPCYLPKFAGKSSPSWRKIRRSKNSTVIDRESNFQSIPVEFFSIAVFFRGELFKILTFWGVAGVRFLFLSEFFIKISECSPSKKNTSEHPLPDLRPVSESWANFGLEQTFKIFKFFQKHISSSGVGQGHSTTNSIRY